MRDPLVTVAVRAARTAGDHMLQWSDRVDQLSITRKGDDGGLVSNIDHECEQYIIAVISKNYPDHRIICEESGNVGTGTDDTFVWLVDPLDGTTNYLHNVPHAAVSIAVLRRGKPMAAVVFDPFRNEMFTAARGAGAQRDGRRIRVSTVVPLSDAMVATTVAYKQHGVFPADALTTVGCAVRDMRRLGAAALDLAWVACARLDGFFGTSLHSWDTAAGALLVTEAGGMVSGFDDQNWLESGHIIASNAAIHDKLRAVIKNPAANALLAPRQR